MKIQLKEDAKLIQQKGRPIPIHLQQSVEKEMEKLIKQGHIEKANNIDEKIRKAQMPNMEELISRTSRKIADGPADGIWISKFDLDFAYGQQILSRAARNLCIFAVTGGNFTSYYRFLKGFYGLADIPTIFQENIDQTLEGEQTPSMVRRYHRGNKRFQRGTHERTDRRPNQTRKRRVQIKPNKIRIFQNRDRTDWSPDRPGRNPTFARQATGDKELKQPNNEKELKSFLGAIHNLSKYIDNLSAQTDSLRQFSKKITCGSGRKNTHWLSKI